ncbi:MAG TPA: carboxypeptidase regulatory-like domain-containing protein, partial [Pyrinomonadaceae bacterium]|nr:carboxypeptidase regulatory-like domain-containing protein [Pyrinomonadaceae bacterium]
MTRPSMRRLLATLIVSIFVCTLTVLTSVVPVSAQNTGSAILRGTVTDRQGAVVSGAAITLINERTQEERQTKTSEDGTYTFPALSPGTYTLKAEGQGFKTSVQNNVTIETSGTQGIDITLDVGAPTETVTVTAGPEQLQTETGARENTISSKQIDNLSIVSRSSLELLRILPGVVAPDNTALESIAFGGGANANSQYHVNGLRGEQNNITIDGSRMIDIGSNNGTVITANPDMVQEVKVQTSNYAAEHGTSAVQISATTKGGSNDFHGSVYDYMRHYKFQANDRSNSINNVARPQSKYNYPGGNIGGPILIPGTKINKNRDKLFFFVGYERYYQQVDEGSNRFIVP